MNAQGVHWTPELLAAVRERDRQDSGDSGLLEIWPDMAPAVLVFFAMDTQWKRGAFGDLQGLDYGVLRPTADLLSLSLDAQAFHDVRVLESETLRIVKRKSRG